MRKLARYMIYLLMAAIVGGAVLFVWAMQRDIDVSSPAAREQQKKSMVLGCKVRLPTLLKKDSALASTTVTPEQADKTCSCAAEQILMAYGATGSIRPTDVPETALDAAALACLSEGSAG